MGRRVLRGLPRGRKALALWARLNVALNGASAKPGKEKRKLVGPVKKTAQWSTGKKRGKAREDMFFCRKLPLSSTKNGAATRKEGK